MSGNDMNASFDSVGMNPSMTISTSGQSSSNWPPMEQQPNDIKKSVKMDVAPIVDQLSEEQPTNIQHEDDIQEATQLSMGKQTLILNELNNYDLAFDSLKAEVKTAYQNIFTYTSGGKVDNISELIDSATNVQKTTTFQLTGFAKFANDNLKWLTNIGLFKDTFDKLDKKAKQLNQLNKALADAIKHASQMNEKYTELTSETQKEINDNFYKDFMIACGTKITSHNYTNAQLSAYSIPYGNQSGRAELDTLFKQLIKNNQLGKFIDFCKEWNFCLNGSFSGGQYLTALATNDTDSYSEFIQAFKQQFSDIDLTEIAKIAEEQN